MKTSTSDVFEVVPYDDISERPQYILKNGKAFNIYAALEYIKEQQEKIRELEINQGSY